MRFMLLVKATGHSEAGIERGDDYDSAWMSYREAISGAGVLLADERLLPSASGVKISYPASGGPPEVTAGPFARETEPVARCVLIDVRTVDEAIAWALRMPNPSGCGARVIEVREAAEDEFALRVLRSQVFTTDLADGIERFRKK
ncbi:YciI family protein [Paenibacillus sacheonensis]|uniref:YciI family protein n=1 Tax=Paenibacillus sacheonensis TaxID=742054 RepID=A0A7X4YR24_9BACL|nr:YciI family protein [Paenibacillus sacheonensis]MBM7567094.1 hypothetical protein [Paenibacillus sacheonensis]NBC70977.1 YciI family protein [Paenibacillus sacheonensis]